MSLSDTVGFIRDLPHGLVEAFRATLQEAVDADLLLHVVDAANPQHPEQMAEVERGAARRSAPTTVPQMLVFNKIDALESTQRPLHLQDELDVDGVQVPRVFVSARTGEGASARCGPNSRKRSQLGCRGHDPRRRAPNCTMPPTDWAQSSLTDEKNTNRMNCKASVEHGFRACST